MIFVQHRPGPVLMRCVRLLWYCKAPGLPHARERILPRGEMQIIVNLAGDTLTEQTDEPDGTVRELLPALLVGARGRYELVDTQELAELVGVVFWPGGAAPFLREDASAFFEKFTSLEDVVSRRDLRAPLAGADFARAQTHCFGELARRWISGQTPRAKSIDRRGSNSAKGGTPSMMSRACFPSANAGFIRSS